MTKLCNNNHKHELNHEYHLNDRHASRKQIVHSCPVMNDPVFNIFDQLFRATLNEMYLILSLFQFCCDLNYLNMIRELYK